MSTNMNLPTPPEKLPNPFREDIMAENGMTTVGWIYHPTQQEIVDKLNEYHDFSEQLVAYLKEREKDTGKVCGYGCMFDGVSPHCKRHTSQEPPQEKECDNCKIEDGGIIRLTNERMCADCGRDMSILSPSQEKECGFCMIGCGYCVNPKSLKEKLSPSQQIDVDALLEDYREAFLVVNQAGWSAREQKEAYKRMSEIEEILTNLQQLR